MTVNIAKVFVVCFLVAFLQDNCHCLVFKGLCPGNDVSVSRFIAIMTEAEDCLKDSQSLLRIERLDDRCREYNRRRRCFIKKAAECTDVVNEISNAHMYNLVAAVFKGFTPDEYMKTDCTVGGLINNLAICMEAYNGYQDCDKEYLQGQFYGEGQNAIKVDEIYDFNFVRNREGLCTIYNRVDYKGLKECYDEVEAHSAIKRWCFAKGSTVKASAIWDFVDRFCNRAGEDCGTTDDWLWKKVVQLEGCAQVMTGKEYASVLGTVGQPFPEDLAADFGHLIGDGAQKERCSIIRIFHDKLWKCIRTVFGKCKLLVPFVLKDGFLFLNVDDAIMMEEVNGTMVEKGLHHSVMSKFYADAIKLCGIDFLPSYYQGASVGALNPLCIIFLGVAMLLWM